MTRVWKPLPRVGSGRATSAPPALAVPAGGVWQWAPGRRGRCVLCEELVEGVWLYWIAPAVSRSCVCGDCAEAVS